MNLVKRFFVLVCILLSANAEVFSSGIKQAETERAVKFTENKNQWDKKVLYRAQLDGGVLFLEKNAFTYHFYDKETLRKNHVNRKGSQGAIRSHAFKMTFLNALPGAKVESKQVTSDYNNYFIGNDRSKWAGNVKNYREVNYSDLYPGIDLQILGMENSMKYNFFVAPGSEPKNIQLSYEGLESISLKKGALVLKTSINEMEEQKPYAFQWIGGYKVEVPCEFVLDKMVVRFRFPKGYNKNYELIIDPVLVFACSSGSTADNFGMTATYDSTGNLYSGGTCFDIGFPTTPGAFDVTYNGIVASGRTDVVITKYDSSGTFLLYSTYLGGAVSTEVVSSLIVNADDELMLYGVTGSSDFPTTAGAFDNTFNGGTYLNYAPNGTEYNSGTDLYAARFNSNGTALLASTFIGGSQNDGVNSSTTLVYNYGDYYRGEIQVDTAGNCYIASCTVSPDFPVTLSCAQPVMGGAFDGIIFKFNPDLTSLIWSTYIGGAADDACYAIALDDTANVYVTGGTASTSFPVTAGALSTTYGGGITDGFVSKISADGSLILRSTFIGTSQYDQAFFLQLDKDFDVYVLGQTLGTMPVSPGVYSNANSRQFIWKLNNDLNTQVFTTVFGNGTGAINISPSAFLVDYCENIYVSGWGGHILLGTPTTGMPLTPDAIQPTTDGFNFYLFVLTSDASNLYYATYFGGGSSQEHVDGGTSRFDKKGIIYQSVCAGCGGNDDFPVTPGSWPNTGANVNHNSNCNNGTFKFDFQLPPVVATFSIDSAQGCAPYTIDFNNVSTPGADYLWDFGNGDTSTVIYNPTITYNTPGTYTVTLTVNNGVCNASDTAIQIITVYPGITADFGLVNAPCSNTVNFFDSSAVGPAAWNWDFGDGIGTSNLQNPVYVYAAAGSYDITLISSTINGCPDTSVFTFVNLSGATVSPGDTICLGETSQLTATGGYAYSWSPSGTLNNSTIASPVASPAATTTYTVTVSTLTSGGDTCILTLTTTVTVYNPALVPLTATADNDTIFEGETTVIHANTDTTLNILWTPLGAFSNPGNFNQTVSPLTTTTYTVTIIDSMGCPRSATVTIYVRSLKCTDESVFVPNTFTPNGDGKNDLFRVKSNSIDEIYFAVYNRWGELMFETTDINAKGWDGIHKGMKADPAVFAWYLKAKCYNGDEFFKKGNVTLIR
ncbi:MAG: PKD domain-containing protein [Bacteroidota bacterium]|nr:PKD domain-containing protein [Bacteroidota bacterium]